MGLFIGKPFLQLDRETGKMRLVTPEPVEFNAKSVKGVGTGSRHGRMNLVLVEKLSKAKK